MVQSFAFTYKDLTLSGANHLEYWSWKDEDTLQTYSREFLDNRFDLDLFYGDFLAGLRLRVLEPSRLQNPYSPEIIGEKIARRYLEYSGEHFNVRVGNYYTTFGRGLTLRTYEDDLIRLDQDLDGVKIQGTVQEADLTILTGQPRTTNFEPDLGKRYYRVINDTTDVIRGVNFTARPQTILSHAQGFLSYSIGGSYVRLNHNNPYIYPQITNVTELFGGNLNLTIGDLGIYGEYAKKTGWDMFRNQMIEGKWDSLGWKELGRNSGILLSLNYSMPGVGVTAQYGDSDSIAVGDPGGLNIRYNSPPPLNRFGLPINKGIDERGYEVSLNLSPLNLLTFELSHAQIQSRDTTSKYPLFPGLSGENKKITEFYGGGRWESYGDYIVSLSVDRLEQIGIFSDVFPVKIETTPLLETSYYIKNDHVVGLSYQHKILDGDYQIEEVVKDSTMKDITISIRESKYYAEKQLSLSYSYSPHFTITLTRESRSNELKVGEETEWLLGELVFEITQNHRLTVRIGEEKGGVICSGGVCRVEPSFDGVKVVLLSRF